MITRSWHRNLHRRERIECRKCIGWPPGLGIAPPSPKVLAACRLDDRLGPSQPAYFTAIWDAPRTLRRAFEGAVERAKLPADLHQHELRHRRVTTWLAAGGDVAKVKEAMGHADLRTTMDYTHLVRENQRSLVEGKPTEAHQEVLAQR